MTNNNATDLPKRRFLGPPVKESKPADAAPAKRLLGPPVKSGGGAVQTSQTPGLTVAPTGRRLIGPPARKGLKNVRALRNRYL